MIGTQEDANRAVAGDLRVLSSYGCTRMVYIANDVVYKVPLSSEFDSCNRDEFRIMSDSSNLPDGVFYPEVSLFNVNGIDVIAMEYISGQRMAECYCVAPEVCAPDCMPNHVWELVNGVLDDTGGFNVIVNDSGVWIIDQGNLTL
jgi:hypothetical protein